MPESDTLRIVYEYDKDGIRPVSRQVVDMVPPKPEPQATASGLHYTLYSKDNHVLFSRSVSDPARHDVEVFAGDGSQTVHREPVDSPHGYFEILLPHHADGHSIALSRTAPGDALAHHLTADPAIKHVLSDIPVLKADGDE